MSFELYLVTEEDQPPPSAFLSLAHLGLGTIVPDIGITEDGRMALCLHAVLNPELCKVGDKVERDNVSKDPVMAITFKDDGAVDRLIKNLQDLKAHFLKERQDADVPNPDA